MKNICVVGVVSGNGVYFIDVGSRFTSLFRR